MTSSIDAEVRRFILGNIPSVPYLEALLLLRKQAAGGAGVEDVARRVYVSTARAAELLGQMQANGVAVREGDARWVFRPQPQLAAMLEQLAELYRRDLLQVTALIHSHSDRGARSFADAFRLRKDD